MAVTAYPYTNAVIGLGLGRFNLPTDAINVMLLNATYTPGRHTHTTTADLTGEVTGSPYTAGGQQLGNVTWQADVDNTKVVLTADPVTWAGATFAGVRYAVIYRNAPTGADYLLSYVDFGASRDPGGADFVLDFSVNGAFWANLPA